MHTFMYLPKTQSISNITKIPGIAMYTHALPPDPTYYPIIEDTYSSPHF